MRFEAAPGSSAGPRAAAAARRARRPSRRIAPAAPSHSDGGVPDVSRTSGRLRATRARARRRSSSRPTAWRPAKACIIAPTFAEAEATLDRVLRHEAVRRSGSEGRHRGSSSPARKRLHRRRRRHARRAPRELAGPQDARRRRPRPEHGRHGRLLAGAGRPTPCTSASCARSCCRPCAGSPRTASTIAAFCTRASIDRRGGQRRQLEFNCRLGDPETQPILFRLRSDLVDVCSSTFDGSSATKPLDWDPRDDRRGDGERRLSRRATTRASRSRASTRRTAAT